MYKALERGHFRVEQIRERVVRTLLAQIPENEEIWIGVDGTPIERPEAKTSEDRGYIHLPNLPLVDKAISIGWQASNVVLLPETPSSWTPALDTRRTYLVLPVTNSKRVCAPVSQQYRTI